MIEAKKWIDNAFVEILLDARNATMITVLAIDENKIGSLIFLKVLLKIGVITYLREQFFVINNTDAATKFVHFLILLGGHLRCCCNLVPLFLE